MRELPDSYDWLLSLTVIDRGVSMPHLLLLRDLSQLCPHELLRHLGPGPRKVSHGDYKALHFPKTQFLFKSRPFGEYHLHP